MRERIGSFLAGAVVGAAVLVAVEGHDLDLLYLQMGKLRAENHQLQEEIDSLKKDLLAKQRQSARKVRKIEVEVKAPDEFTKLEIDKFVKDRTRALLDKELSYLDSAPQLVKGLIDGRTLTIENQPYLLRVESVAIGETLRLWVEGSQKPVSP